MRNHPLDDLVGLDLSPARRDHLIDQICGTPVRPPTPFGVPAGLAPFMTLPKPEPATLTRARMAQTMASLMAANGRVTRDDLEQAGFTRQQIEDHRDEAARIARLDRMQQ